MLQGRRSTLARHVYLGLAAGVVFGASIVAVTIAHSSEHHLAQGKLLGLVINEMLFPIGCSVVLYLVGHLPDRHAVAESGVDLAS
jgi:formate/nitrite transporter FocA (FNT family)